MLDPEELKGFDDMLTRAAKISRGSARQIEFVLATALRLNVPLMQLIEAMRRLQAGPPVAGYEAFLLDAGCPASEARLTARAIHYFGEALKQENEAERFLASALRAIAKAAGKSTIVIARRAKALRDRTGNGFVQDALDQACTKAGRPDLAAELLEAIKKAADRDPAACQMLVLHAASLLPHLANPRGRPLDVATAKHELLLDELHYRGRPRTFTWNPVEENFVDPATQATRTAVGNPSFDPRFAARRLKRRIDESSQSGSEQDQPTSGL